MKKLQGLPFLKAAMQDAKASKVRLRPTRRMDTGNCAEVSTARGFALCGPLYSDRKPLPETTTQGLVQVYKQAGPPASASILRIAHRAWRPAILQKKAAGAYATAAVSHCLTTMWQFRRRVPADCAGPAHPQACCHW